jgi:hypothetical protein
MADNQIIIITLNTETHEAKTEATDNLTLFEALAMLEMARISLVDAYTKRGQDGDGFTMK